MRYRIYPPYNDNTLAAVLPEPLFRYTAPRGTEEIIEMEDWQTTLDWLKGYWDKYEFSDGQSLDHLLAIIKDNDMLENVMRYGKSPKVSKEADK